MLIKNSQVWLNYTASFSRTTLNDYSIAYMLLKAGITECIVSSEGEYYTIEEDELKVSSLNYESNAKMNFANFNFGENKISDFHKEALYQNALNHFYEKRIFSFNTNFIDNTYLRFSIDEILIKNNSREYSIYPFVNIYTSGAIIIENRIIVDSSIDSDELINEFINISNTEFLEVLTNKALSKISYRMNDIIEEPKKYLDETRDFTFNLYDFIIPDGRLITITNINLCIFNILEYLFNIAFKKDQEKVEVAEFWFAKPHVHIIDFEKQQKKSSENYNLNQHLIRQILNRMPYSDEIFNNCLEIKDLRFFEDYNYFFNMATSLSIWSKTGIENNIEFNDENKNGFIYTNQIINRFLDYYQILYKKTAYIIERNENYEDLLRFQSDLYKLKIDILHISKSGEIYEILKYANKELNIDYHEKILLSMLENKQKQIENIKNKRANSAALIVTILFGILSSGNLANDLLIPLFKYFKIPQFANYYLNKITFWIVAFIIIMISIKLIFKLLQKIKI